MFDYRKSNLDEAYNAIVSALYFSDSSDYLPALKQAFCHISGANNGDGQHVNKVFNVFLLWKDGLKIGEDVIVREKKVKYLGVSPNLFNSFLVRFNDGSVNNVTIDEMSPVAKEEQSDIRFERPTKYSIGEHVFALNSFGTIVGKSANMYDVLFKSGIKAPVFEEHIELVEIKRVPTGSQPFNDGPSKSKAVYTNHSPENCNTKNCKLCLRMKGEVCTECEGKGIIKDHHKRGRSSFQDCHHCRGIGYRPKGTAKAIEEAMFSSSFEALLPGVAETGIAVGLSIQENIAIQKKLVQCAYGWSDMNTLNYNIKEGGSLGWNLYGNRGIFTIKEELFSEFTRFHPSSFEISYPIIADSGKIVPTSKTNTRDIQKLLFAAGKRWKRSGSQEVKKCEALYWIGEEMQVSECDEAFENYWPGTHLDSDFGLINHTVIEAANDGKITGLTPDQSYLIQYMLTYYQIAKPYTEIKEMSTVYWENGRIFYGHPLNVSQFHHSESELHKITDFGLDKPLSCDRAKVGSNVISRHNGVGECTNKGDDFIVVSFESGLVLAYYTEIEVNKGRVRSIDELYSLPRK